MKEIGMSKSVEFELVSIVIDIRQRPNRNVRKGIGTCWENLVIDWKRRTNFRVTAGSDWGWIVDEASVQLPLYVGQIKRHRITNDEGDELIHSQRRTDDREGPSPLIGEGNRSWTSDEKLKTPARRFSGLGQERGIVRIKEESSQSVGHQNPRSR